MMRLGTAYREMVIRALKMPLKGNRVLDIGCHDGYFLSKICCEKRTGIDLQPEKKYPDIHYISADFLEYDFKGEKFDLILALDVIEHIEDDEYFFQKFLSLLAPGGLGLFTTPSKTIKVFPAFLQPWVDKRWDHVYRRGYSQNEILEFLSKKTDNLTQFNISCKVWNASYFRALYFPLSVIWRISESLTLPIIQKIVNHELLGKDNENGFLIIKIKNCAKIPESE